MQTIALSNGFFFHFLLFSQKKLLSLQQKTAIEHNLQS